ncbi:unnamed protein product, partial [Symbiodinium sp. CCMP2456]
AAEPRVGLSFLHTGHAGTGCGGSSSLSGHRHEFRRSTAGEPANRAPTILLVALAPRAVADYW